MKGITHFTVGVGLASFFPESIHAAAAGNPAYFLLGGFFGLLPDTLDFKFFRFFYRSHICVVPDPLNPLPSQIAGAVAYAIDSAASMLKPVRIKLETIRLASDLWQRYTVRFDVSKHKVIVVYGPAVDTGGNIVSEKPVRMSRNGPVAIEDPKWQKSGESRFNVSVKIEYQPDIQVDIFDGPLLEMSPDAGGKIAVGFIPWHRLWTHSYVAALLPAGVVAAVFNPTAGVIAFGAIAAHTAVDQLGFMGSSLWYPIRRKRIPGAGKLHGSAPFANFAVIWLCCLLVFWNLAYETYGPSHIFSLPKLLFWGLAVPLGAVMFLNKSMHRLERFFRSR